MLAMYLEFWFTKTSKLNRALRPFRALLKWICGDIVAEFQWIRRKTRFSLLVFVGQNSRYIASMAGGGEGTLEAHLDRLVALSKAYTARRRQD